MTRHEDRWHVFFQHNPLRAQHAAIHWGHVSSADLVAWTEHPVAFGPQPGGPDRGGCWSGSFLPGVGRPAVVYTGITGGPERSTVCLRYALDQALETWSDPIVVAREPDDADLQAMRDPYPFQWGGRRFALVGAGMTDGTPSVLLFSCDDPHAWRFECVWLTGRDEVAAKVAPANIWECPQLVRFGDSHVLVLSLWVDGRLEDVVYLAGSMQDHPQSGGLPRFVPHTGGKLDHGPDFYAPQVIDDGAELPLLFGWIQQEDAPDDAPDGTVAGCLTFPRRLALRDGGMQVRPDPALEALVGQQVPLPKVRPGRVDADQQPQPVRFPLRAKVVIGPRAGEPAPRLDLLGNSSRTTLEVDSSGCEIWLDGEVAEVFRSGTIASTIRSPGTTSWSLAGDVDRCAVTVYELALTVSPPAGRAAARAARD